MLPTAGLQAAPQIKRLATPLRLNIMPMSQSRRVSCALSLSSTFALLFLAVTGSACVSQSEHNRVVAELQNTQAKLDSASAENEELRNGPTRRLGQAEAFLAKRDFVRAASSADSLVMLHLGTPESRRAEAIAVLARNAERERVAAVAKARADSVRADSLRLARALSSMRRTYDDVREIAFYQDRTIPVTNSRDKRVFAYIVHSKGSEPRLRLKIRYSGDDWLFVRSYTFKVDGQTFNVSPDGLNDVERDNSAYSGIWEWYDTPAGPFETELLRALARSQSATLRYNGDTYYSDRTVSSAEKQAIQRTFAALEVLKRGQP